MSMCAVLQQCLLWQWNHFQDNGSGHLVGVSSVASYTSAGISPPYRIQSICLQLSEGMRSRAQHSGLPITVTTVEPGFVDTPMVDWQAIWMAPVDKAVAQMVKAILKRKTMFLLPNVGE